MYQPIFGFYRYLLASVGVCKNKTLLYSSHMQTTCTRKQTKSRQSSSVAILRGGGLGGPWPPKFFLNFLFKFVWFTCIADNFRPAIF